MSEETNWQGLSDPMKVWEQWYETATKGWSRAVSGNGSKPSYPDPFGFYQTWLKSIGEAQEQFKTSSPDPRELWKRWFDVTIDMWGKTAEVGGDPFGLITQWVKMMEEARTTLLAGSKLPADPSTFFKQWYDAISETWSTSIGEVIGTEKFTEVASEFLKSYTSFYAAMCRASEEYFRNLQLATRADIARVAELVVNLENKVDGIDSGLEKFEDGIGSNLDQLPPMLHKLESIEHLEKRMDRVEGKLDTLLTAMEKLANREAIAPPTPPETARHTTRRKAATPTQKANKAEAQNGQVG